MKIDWKRKLTSRKFWLAVASTVAGIVIICNGNAELVDKICGTIMSFGSVFGYLLAEGLIDSSK